MELESFRDSCERFLPVTLDFLREMVAINSFTSNVAGVNAVAAVVAEKFADLGFQCERVPGRENCGDHLFPMQEPGTNRPSIALLSHLDTVFPPEEEERNHFVWRREENRIYGPGTNDIKGGTAMIYLLLAAMREAAPELYAGVNWVIALNACEEVDSTNFGATCRRLLPVETTACLVFEADGGEGDRFSVVAARKGRATFTVRVEGRAAHAGGGHASGANAIVELAGVVGRLSALTDYAADVTVNVGKISGGTVNNRVPHEAMATLEMRAFDMRAYERTKSAILAMSGEGGRNSEGHACRIRVTLDEEAAPWPRNAETERLAEIWHTAGADIGLRVAREARGGLSDGNELWQRFPTLDGLGPRGENSHCSEQSADGSKEQEWVDVSSFAPKALLNAHAIELLLH